MIRKWQFSNRISGIIDAKKEKMGFCYAVRFKAMPAEKIPVGEVARLTGVMDKVAVRQGLAPYKIAQNFKQICEQFGIHLTDDFVKIPEYEQLKLPVEVM